MKWEALLSLSPFPMFLKLWFPMKAYVSRLLFSFFVLFFSYLNGISIVVDLNTSLFFVKCE